MDEDVTILRLQTFRSTVDEQGGNVEESRTEYKKVRWEIKYVMKQYSKVVQIGLLWNEFERSFYRTIKVIRKKLRWFCRWTSLSWC